MQINYSLASAGLTYSASVTDDARPQPQNLVGPSPLDAVQQPFSRLGLALANAGVVINRLVMEQVLLRETLETFNASLLKSLEVRQTVDGSATEKKTSTEPASTQARREAYEASTTRLSTAVDKAQAPVVDTSLMLLTDIVDGLTALAEALPKTTAALSLAGAALAPLVSGVFGAVTDKLYEKAAEKILGGGASPASSGAGKTGESTSTPTKPGKTKGASIKPGRQGLFGQVAKVGSAVEKAALPLMLVGASVDIGRGLASGDMKAVGTGVASAGGAVAGGYAGSAIGGFVGARIGGIAGAALGSIIPGAGTLLGGVLGSVAGNLLGKAVGGVVGNFVGSDLGGWLSEKVMGPADRLPPPADVSKNLGAVQAANQALTFAPQITINAPEQASNQELATLVVQQIEAQFTPLSMGDLLGARSGAALNDGRV
ncbi:hypothetical protein [Pseudomonas sp. SDO5271_S396]